MRATYIVHGFVLECFVILNLATHEHRGHPTCMLICHIHDMLFYLESCGIYTCSHTHSHGSDTTMSYEVSIMSVQIARMTEQRLS